MVFFPAVQAVLNAEPRPDPSPPPTLPSRTPSTSNDEHSSTSTTQVQGHAGPGPSTSSNSARFAPVQVGGRMAPPQSTLVQGPIRKQNIACDACRSRKIRCQRTTIHQIVSPHPHVPTHPSALRTAYLSAVLFHDSATQNEHTMPMRMGGWILTITVVRAM